MNDFCTEGVCGDGAAILRDGQPMTITEILATLNEVAYLRNGHAEFNKAISYALTKGVEGLYFLECWNEGDWNSIHYEFPDFNLAEFQYD